jgi:hypothetical protein
MSIEGFSSSLDDTIQDDLWDALEAMQTEGRVWSRKAFFDTAIVVERRLHEHIFSQDGTDERIQNLTAALAWIGASAIPSYSPQEALALQQDMAGYLSWQKGPDGKWEVVPVGLWKSTKKFWKEHKVEIIVAIAVIAIVVVAAVAISMGSAAAAAAVAANAEAFSSEPECRTPPPSEPIAIAPSPQPETLPQLAEAKAPEPIYPFTEPSPFVPSTFSWHIPSSTLYQSDIVARQLLWPETSSLPDSPVPPMTLPELHQRLNEALPPTAPSHEVGVFESHPPFAPDQTSIVGYLFRNIGREMEEDDIARQDIPAPETPVTKEFSLSGMRYQGMRIGGINGMYNSPSEAESNAHYLQKFTQGQVVDWTYNRSHLPLVDAAEIFLYNYRGSSPNTADSLTRQWTEFHEANRDNPHAKYLQFGHSQGCIHIRNALENAPEEIRNRIIVVAVAPAIVIPKRLCYDSNNYASRSDIVYYGKMVFDAVGGEFMPVVDMLSTWEEMKELQILEPHPESSGLDHGFQSKTFERPIQTVVDEYIDKKGQYP